MNNRRHQLCNLDVIIFDIRFKSIHFSTVTPNHYSISTRIFENS